MSLRGEYLPTTDSAQWHIKGIRDRLDREFRLVREDTVGQLQDAIRQGFDLLRTPNGGRAGQSRNGLWTYTYYDSILVDATFDFFRGLEPVVRCIQPTQAQELDLKGRKGWLLQSRRLQAGAFVCAIDAVGSAYFCVVSSSMMRTEEDARLTGKKERVRKKTRLQASPAARA